MNLRSVGGGTIFGSTLPENEGALTRDYVSMRRRFLREVISAGLPAGPGPVDVVTDTHVIPLPEPVQRYLRFMGVIGRPRDWSFRLGYTGKFRTKPQQPWLKCEAWQYNSRLAPVRIFHIRIRFGGLLSVVGRDTRKGRGRMLIRLLDLITVEDAKGEEYDIGELVTYLNDAVRLPVNAVGARRFAGPR